MVAELPFLTLLLKVERVLRAPVIRKQQAVKKSVAPKFQGEKRRELKGGGQEMVVIIRSSMAKIFITTIQVNLCVLQVSLGLGTKFT